jgi:tetratricopeptide (TPR) repeat protein
LEIDKKLGRLEGMANAYAGLGIIYGMNLDLDRAEELLKKALEIHERMGQQEGMASDYGNLGIVYKQRGDLEKTREYWEKSRDLYKNIGIPNEVKKVEGQLEEIKGK